jgi:hypothetical protein
MRLRARHGLMLVISMFAASCLRYGYDALASESGGGGSGIVGGVGEAGDGAIAGGADAGGGGTTAGSGGSAGGGTASAGTGGVPPALPGPPIAAFTLSPPAGATSTEFSADASGSSDAEDTFDALVFDWDWQSDGTYDDSGATARHIYGAAGDYAVTLRVTDTDGNTAFATRTVAVVDPVDLLLVNIGIDEDDNGATAAMPGGSGLSLREAMNIANGTTGRQLITFEPGITVAVAFGLPVLSDIADVYGNGTAVDGSALGGNGPCLRLLGTVRLFDLEVYGCPGAPIAIQGGNDSVVSRCYVHDNGTSVQSLNGANNVIGPDNEIARSADAGLYVNSADVTVIGNTIHGNAGETLRTGGGAQRINVHGNLLLGGTTSIVMAGSEATIWHNTVVDAQESGIQIVNASGIDLRNNIFVDLGGYAISGSDADFATQDYNLFFATGGGTCSACTAGPASIELDPLFVDADAGDYRLSASSPAIDAGIDVGLPFSGNAPDLGYYESNE